jgi:hypothetical protein
MRLHPGAHAALRLMHGDELDVAEMIRDGDLTSPQYVANMALFKIRVTGIGYAYRPKHDEYVYRRPENYLTQRFLDRCNGLPVIWEHPDKAVLTSEEFAKRIVGSVTLPFIENDEVWAIAKIWDKTAAAEMSAGDLSTSPSVVFRDPAVNLKLELDDGSTLLVEGAASLLDHVAICEHGVWDKEHAPDGVVSHGDRDEMQRTGLARMADSIDGLENRVNIWAILQRIEGGKTRGPPPMERDNGRSNGRHHNYV